MVDVERKEGVVNGNIVEITAMFLAGRIKLEDMDENNSINLKCCLELMKSDNLLREKIVSRKNEIVLMPENSRIIPLFTDYELTEAHAYKTKKRKSKNKWLKPRLFEEPLQNHELFEDVVVVDPEKGLAKLHNDYRLHFGRVGNGLITKTRETLIAKEVKDKKMELREIIGLPVARGKDEHINDDFYKYLVRRVVEYDTFGIFIEFDRAITETSLKLDRKILAVKGLINQLLNGGLNLPERRKMFAEFVWQYQKKQEEDW